MKRSLSHAFLTTLLAVGLSTAGCGGGGGGGGEAASPAARTVASSTSPSPSPAAERSYRVVDTNQTLCYGNAGVLAAPAAGQAFYGQDAQFSGPRHSYTVSGSTVQDSRTGLTWQRSPDTNGDGAITAADKLTWTQVQARPAALNAAAFGGHSDWRVPTIKELYSLILFSGTDPSGLAGTDTSGLTPFLDRASFAFAYGDTGAGERIIDAQYASSDLYVGRAWGEGTQTLFGVNFADGRIKGYNLVARGAAKTFLLLCVRGNPSYGRNSFVDHGDGTVGDLATGLMWSRSDSGSGMNWQEALDWVQTRNAAGYLGHRDWRLPNAKELQSLVDYSRSPDTTSTAAIDPVFSCTSIQNEAGQSDYPCYWTGTTHASSNGSGGYAAYVAFGRAMGYMDGGWRDVHGAGAQRSDPKSGNAADWPTGNGPQGDAIRIRNYVRIVRDLP